MTNQLVDLLNAAKLIADREGNIMLGYLISMAIVEARTASEAPRKKAA